jgi:hypothetical protein
MKNTRNRGPAGFRAKSSGNRLYVVVHSDGWVVRSDTGSQTRVVYATQVEATAAAQKHLRIHGGELFVQERKGRWRETFTIGREAMGKINSVEGISLTGEIKRDLRAFDRSNLSTVERQRAVAKKYGKKRG